MSVLLSAVTDAATQHLAAAGHPLTAADAAGGNAQGIIDWLTAKNTAVQTLSRGFSITAAIIFVIYQAIRSAGAMARILVAGIAAAIFVWIVFNVTNLQTRVNNEVNSSPAPHSVIHQPTGGQPSQT